MKTLLAVVALAAAVLLIKPNKIKDEVVQIPISDAPAIIIAEKLIATQEVKKLTLKKDRVITLRSQVDAISAQSVIRGIRDLQNSSEPIYLLLDSPGGSVIDGAQILSTMEASKAPIYTICLKMCASMAFVIHQYGTKRMAVNRSILMAHPASGGVNPGQIPNLVSLLKTMTNYIDKMDAHIAKRAGLDITVFHNMIAHELWLDAEDATRLKFNDELVYIMNDIDSSVIVPTTDERVRNIRR